MYCKFQVQLAHANTEQCETLNRRYPLTQEPYHTTVAKQEYTVQSGPVTVTTLFTVCTMHLNKCVLLVWFSMKTLVKENRNKNTSRKHDKMESFIVKDDGAVICNIL
jgi:hypothetical protein